MRLTINEIAEMAQVAKSTVSKALNGQKGVSEDKRKRILCLADELDYHPNASAQALASSRSLAVGLVLPHYAGRAMAGAYWTAIISAIAQESRSRGYSLLILAPGSDDDLSKPIETAIKRRNVDGLLIGAENLDAKAVAVLSRCELPFVMIGRSPRMDHYSVDVDNAPASKRIVAHLASRGCSRIACLAGPSDFPYTRDRVRGYREALAEAGLDWSAVVHSSYLDGDTGAAVSRLLEEGKDMDALFVTAGGDFVLDAIDALRGSGKDLSSIGMAAFDDYRFFDYMSLPISTIRQPLQEMGSMAASVLLDLIGGCAPEQTEWILPTEMVLR
jgi:LacI family transcriptional regulator